MAQSADDFLKTVLRSGLLQSTDLEATLASVSADTLSDADALAEHFVQSGRLTSFQAGKLRAGNYGWGHAKQDLFEALNRELAPMREKYEALRPNEKELDRLLEEGAEEARKIARATVRRVRTAIGID